MHDEAGEALPILIRTFATELPADGDPEPGAGKPKSKKGRNIPPIGPANLSLVFDTETTSDPAMRCRLGVYQLRGESGECDERLFYDPREAFSGDTDMIRAYAAARGLPEPITLDAFRDVLLAVIEAGGQVIGFNLPFDLSRVAIGSAPAKAGKWNRRMRGAHSLRFWPSDYKPRIQVKHVNPRLAFMGCSAPNPGQSRSASKRRDHIPADRGTFIDVRTLASALLSGGYSLERLANALGTSTRKAGTAEHGQPLTFDYLDYARADVQATWECFVALRDRYATYGLSAPLAGLSSEASVGKAMLADMGVTINADRSPAHTARSFHGYFGGRTEVRIRREITRVVQTDFTSMYPTVCTLMGLWRFVVANGMTESDTTDATRAALAAARPDDWQDRDAWRGLTTVVRVRCARDLFPVRSYYQGEQHASIGLNRLTFPEPLWFTYADCLAAKFLSGKTPEIIEAVTFAPGPRQPGLKPIGLLGRITIAPYRDDPYRELVIMREQEKARLENAPEAERAALDAFSQLLKIMVNSASYGIFVQVNVANEERKVARLVHVHGLPPFVARIAKSESPEPYFHPLLGTLITGAARLMLALAQHRAGEEGLGWAFCDTDSIALAKPDAMADPDFIARAERVSAWFKPLNPYGLGKSLLKVEDVNYRLGTREHEPLYCYAIASKRYALFNIGSNGVPVIRKATAHGLGHFVAPYGDDNGAPGFPPPLADLKAGKDRLARWQYDVWFAILSHELSPAVRDDPTGMSCRVKFDYHPALSRPAVSKYAATSPAMLRWLDPINRDLAYPDRVKPFGLLYGLHAKRRPKDFTGVHALAGTNPNELHPIAPFHPGLETAVSLAFDRVTGRPIDSADLQTYADALFNYPYKQESKFLNGEAFQRGVTRPRHVIAVGVHYTGKEADRWEEDFLIGLGHEPMTKFGSHPKAAVEVYTEIRMAVRVHGAKPVSDATGLARTTIDKVCDGQFVRTKVSHESIKAGLQHLALDLSRRNRERRLKLERWERAIEEAGGIRAAAKKLGMDFSNLSKAMVRYRGTPRNDDGD